MTPNPKFLTPEQRERWEERAAIREHDGKMPRSEAEQAAWEELFVADKPDDSLPF